jgi:hypothetical protein
MPAEDDTPKCDTGALAFPSDAITLGKIRHGEPHLFTWEAMRDRVISDCDAISTLRIEMRLAEKAFTKGLGLPDPYPSETEQRDVLIEDLDEAYREYGLSTGKRASLELIRRFESDAAAQAQRFRGPTR